MTNNSKLIILRGNSGSGKTTTAKALQQSKVYRPLYEVCIQEFGSNIYAYYYDLPFEETLRRHETKPNRHEFGESAMRRWWSEKDYIGIIDEKIILQEMEQEETVEMIYKEITKHS